MRHLALFRLHHGFLGSHWILHLHLVSSSLYLSYITTMLGGSYMYYSRILRVSDSDYMGQGILSQEGVPTAVALFLVSEE